MNTIHVEPTGHLRFADMACRSALGRGGVVAAEDKREGDGATPAGRWPLRFVLYRPDRVPMPSTGLPVRALSPMDGWCDDPASGYYNRPITLPFDGSHEILWREDHIYDILVVLGHNDDPPIAGRGSAIFFHLARANYAPTAGCVAIGLADMLALLGRLSTGATMDIHRLRQSH